jgi:hypothetical protein|nr:hypothetical protein [Mesorhizobium sp.]
MPGPARCAAATAGASAAPTVQMRVRPTIAGIKDMPQGFMRSGIRLALAGTALVAGLTAASEAHAAEQGEFSTTSSEAESLVFNPATVTTTNIVSYSTQILARLNGGVPIYDQTFDVPFSDPAPQAGVTAARAAITTAGGPGVIIAAPVLTASSSNTTSASVTSYSLAGTQAIVNPGLATSGPANLLVGQLSTCNVALLPNTTRPPCQSLTQTPLVLSENDSNVNVRADTVYTIDRAMATTSTTQFEQWTLFGTVQAFGMAHTAVQSGALDANSRFLRRLGDEAGSGDQRPVRMWMGG